MLTLFYWSVSPFLCVFNILQLLVILGKVSANYFICLQTYQIVCLVDPLSVFLIVQITAFNPMQDNWKRKNCYSVIVSQLGFYYLLADQRK